MNEPTPEPIVVTVTADNGDETITVYSPGGATQGSTEGITDTPGLPGGPVFGP